MNAPIYADLDQIVFEHRSREYGAYQMRKRYNQILMRAMLIAFLLFISITGLPKMLSWISPAELAVEPDLFGEEVFMPPAPEPPKDPIEKEVIEVAPAQPASTAATVDVRVPTPTPDDLVRDEATIAEMSRLDSAAVGLEDHDGTTGDLSYPWEDLDGECLDCIPQEVVVKDTLPAIGTFVLLEKEPQAVNMDELKGLIGYPPMAREAEIQGKVILRILIDQNGDYLKHAVLKDPHPILTRAVEKQVPHLKMTPGIQAGRPIKVWVTVPFEFTIRN